MERMKLLGKAIRMAAEVHENQYDKAGVPYILHCLAVMQMAGERVKDCDQEVVMIIGVLHDTLEDFKGTPLERIRLREQISDLFGPKVDKALQALTHRSPEPYEDYIERVALDWIARVVKIADLTHNMDPRRIPASQIVDKDFQRWDKYRKALIRLERE